MTAELLGTLPWDVRVQIFKYLRHPLAEIAMTLPNVKYDNAMGTWELYSPFDMGVHDAMHKALRDADALFYNMTPEDIESEAPMSPQDAAEINEYHDGYDFWLACLNKDLRRITSRSEDVRPTKWGLMRHVPLSDDV